MRFSANFDNEDDMRTSTSSLKDHVQRKTVSFDEPVASSSTMLNPGAPPSEELYEPPSSFTKLFPWSACHQRAYSSPSHSLFASLSPSLSHTSTLQLNGRHHLIIQNICSADRPILDVDVIVLEDEEELKPVEVVIEEDGSMVPTEQADDAQQSVDMDVFGVVEPTEQLPKEATDDDDDVLASPRDVHIRDSRPRFPDFIIFEDDSAHSIFTQAQDGSEPMEFAEPGPDYEDVSIIGYIPEDVGHSRTSSFASSSSPSPSKKLSFQLTDPHVISRVTFPTMRTPDERGDIRAFPTYPSSPSPGSPRRSRPSLRKVLSATRRSLVHLGHRDESPDAHEHDHALAARRHSSTSHTLVGSHESGDDNVSGPRNFEGKPERQRRWSLKRLTPSKSMTSGNGMPGLHLFGRRSRKSSEISSAGSEGHLAQDESEDVKKQDHRPHKLLKRRRVFSHV